MAIAEISNLAWTELSNKHNQQCQRYKAVTSIILLGFHIQW